MQSLKPVDEETNKSNVHPFIPVKEEPGKPSLSSFMSVKNEPDEYPRRWKIGIEPQRVTVYVVLALVAGFALGFGASQFIINKNSASQRPASAGKQPRDLASPTGSTAASGPTEFHRVARLARADTIEVEGVGLVRMIGIETPDGKSPQEVYGPYGQQALRLVETMLLDEEVRLELDPATKADGDQSGQTPAYVYKKDGTLVNGELLKQGLAFVRSGEQFRLSDLFRSLERDAMQSLRGIWSGSSAAQSPSADQTGSISTTLPTPSPTGSKPRLSPLDPSAIGPNIPATTGATVPTVPSEPVVFVSEDRKFHNRSSCDLLDKKKNTLGVSQAKAQGYTACSRCYPSHTLQVR